MNTSRREFISTLGLSAMGGMLSGCGALRPNPPNPLLDPPKLPCAWRDLTSVSRIAVVGDIQRTSMAELTLLNRKQHDEERREILNAIAMEKPDMLLMLGDQVAMGEGDPSWHHFDEFVKNINYADIPVRALLGNHDYSGRSLDHALHHFCDRFPAQKKELHGVTIMGSIALVTIDSNLEYLTPRQQQQQLQKYLAALDDLDANPDIRGIIAASHHPPFSNGGYSLKREIKDLFAVPFIRNRKSRLYFSGHVHNYQRFKSGDKTFIVSGGGGGAPHDIDVSSRRAFHEEQYNGPAQRPFHYVMLTIETNERTGEAKIKGETMMLQTVERRGVKNFSFKAGDTFSVGLYG